MLTHCFHLWFVLACSRLEPEEKSRDNHSHVRVALAHAMHIIGMLINCVAAEKAKF